MDGSQQAGYFHDSAVTLPAAIVGGKFSVHSSFVAPLTRFRLKVERLSISMTTPRATVYVVFASVDDACVLSLCLVYR